jgi:tetratricopeptide (TPR) repeat protein
MSKTLAWTTVLGACVWSLTAGCDRPVGPPKTANHKVPKSLAVAPGNAAERGAVTAAEEARVNYHYRLTVLRSYYKNLAQAHTFTWEGVAEVNPPKGESLASADEHLLVEYTVSARKAYLKALRDLVKFYRSADANSYKAERVANILDRFDPVRTYMYFMEAELPPASLRPVEVIPEAEEMYAKGIQLYEEGKGIFRTFVTTDYRKERRALEVLLRLVRTYPQSTKIALAAYHIGEIYKEYFNENLRAVHWYERAWQWDANLTKPARFHAAAVHDYRLYNRAKAVELYRQTIIHEQFNASNVRFAHQRIRELTGT